MAVGPSMRDAKMVKAPHESRMRAVAVATVYGAGMYVDTERNSKRRECRTWRLACATVPPSEGAGAGVGAAGTKGTGHVRAPGTEVGVGAGDCGAGTCAFVTATTVTRRCARLRSVLRWLTRRLEAYLGQKGCLPKWHHAIFSHPKCAKSISLLGAIQSESVTRKPRRNELFRGTSAKSA